MTKSSWHSNGILLILVAFLIGAFAARALAVETTNMHAASVGLAAVALFALTGLYELATGRIPNLANGIGVLLYIIYAYVSEASWLGLLYGLIAFLIAVYLWQAKVIPGGAAKLISAGAFWSHGVLIPFVIATVVGIVLTRIYYTLRPAKRKRLHTGAAMGAASVVAALMQTLKTSGLPALF